VSAADAVEVTRLVRADPRGFMALLVELCMFRGRWAA
jgi:hypothetical protein